MIRTYSDNSFLPKVGKIHGASKLGHGHFYFDIQQLMFSKGITATTTNNNICIVVSTSSSFFFLFILVSTLLKYSTVRVTPL
jgi:hypothetical protein